MVFTYEALIRYSRMSRAAFFNRAPNKVSLVFLKLADFWEKPGAKIVVVFDYAGEGEGGYINVFVLLGNFRVDQGKNPCNPQGQEQPPLRSRRADATPTVNLGASTVDDRRLATVREARARGSLVPSAAAKASTRGWPASLIGIAIYV
jgi:hypothetical protein